MASNPETFPARPNGGLIGTLVAIILLLLITIGFMAFGASLLSNVTITTNPPIASTTAPLPTAVIAAPRPIYQAQPINPGAIVPPVPTAAPVLTTAPVEPTAEITKRRNDAAYNRPTPVPMTVHVDPLPSNPTAAPTPTDAGGIDVGGNIHLGSDGASLDTSITIKGAPAPEVNSRPNDTAEVNSRPNPPRPTEAPNRRPNPRRG